VIEAIATSLQVFIDRQKCIAAANPCGTKEGMRMVANYTIDDLRYLMARLRNPETGCPWDLKQTYATVAKHTLEEVYEVIDAIERNDLEHLAGELGDLLFQIIFYSQLADEEDRFDFDVVVDGIVSKLVRRHPHVFPEGTLRSVRDSANVADGRLEEAKIHKVWEELKQEERSAKGDGKILDDIPLALPALSRAQKLQKRAAIVGFDWQNTADVIAKVKEELLELEVEIHNNNQAAIKDELGDLIFSCVNLARHLQVDAEEATRRANYKFKTRFDAMESLVAKRPKNSLALYTAEQLESLWNEVKRAD